MTPKDHRGSRRQCLLLTSLTRVEIAETLTNMASPFVTVDPEPPAWMPKCILKPDEARLDGEPDFLSDVERDLLRDW